MHTLFDFMTHIKGVEYLVAVGAIAAYILYWEMLKKRPFKTLVNAAKEDIGHMKKDNWSQTWKTAGKVAAAPFIGLAYIVMIPLTFVVALAAVLISAVGRLLGAEASFGWRPVEAYFGGRKDTVKGKDGEAQ